MRNDLQVKELRKIAIIGPGLLGGSVALGLKSAGVTAEIVGIGHRQASLDRAVAIGAIDVGSVDMAAAAGAEVVILAVPIGQFDAMLSSLAEVISPGTIVTDVGSTKRQVCRLAAKRLPKGVTFVGSHPMAGSEKRGVEFARSDLCLGATCIVTPERRTPASSAGLIESLWQAIGMRVVRMAPAQHDRILAKISHLPHVVASALVNLCSEDELKVSGMGFLDTTRIASGDVGLWHDIVVSNADGLRSAIGAIRRQLDRLESAIEAGDSKRIRAFLQTGKDRRDWLMRYKIDAGQIES